MHAVAVQLRLRCLLTVIAAVFCACGHFAGACGMSTVALLSVLFIHRILSRACRRLSSDDIVGFSRETTKIAARPSSSCSGHRCTVVAAPVYRAVIRWSSSIESRVVVQRSRWVQTRGSNGQGLLDSPWWAPVAERPPSRGCHYAFPVSAASCVQFSYPCARATNNSISPTVGTFFSSSGPPRLPSCSPRNRRSRATRAAWLL
jgi:hypothetical protein